MASTKLLVAKEAKKLVAIHKNLESLYGEYDKLIAGGGFYRSDFAELDRAIDNVREATYNLASFIRFANSQREL